jgi:hypothetical protein
VKACLQLEAIGDNSWQHLCLWRSVINDNLPGVGDALIGSVASRQWVAEIVGTDTRYKWRRHFLRGYKDYALANGIGSRGVYVFYILESGHIYEVKDPQSWKHCDRYFCRVTDDGDIEKIAEKEVREWFASAHLE